MLRANGTRLLFLPLFIQRSLETYSESLEVIDGQGVAEQVKERILEHAAVAVAALGRNACQSHDFARGFSLGCLGEGTYERTNRSRFSQLGFLGLNFMNLSQRT